MATATHGTFAKPQQFHFSGQSTFKKIQEWQWGHGYLSHRTKRDWLKANRRVANATIKNRILWRATVNVSFLKTSQQKRQHSAFNFFYKSHRRQNPQINKIFPMANIKKNIEHKQDFL